VLVYTCDFLPGLVKVGREKYNRKPDTTFYNELTAMRALAPPHATRPATQRHIGHAAWLERDDNTAAWAEDGLDRGSFSRAYFEMHRNISSEKNLTNKAYDLELEQVPHICNAESMVAPVHIKGNHWV
jgi:hypothetical protein